MQNAQSVKEQRSLDFKSNEWSLLIIIFEIVLLYYNNILYIIKVTILNKKQILVGLNYINYTFKDEVQRRQFSYELFIIYKVRNAQ